MRSARWTESNLTETARAAAARGAGTLWALTAGQRLRYVAAIGAMGLGSVFLLLVPYVLQDALDSLSEPNADVVRTLVLSAAAIVGFNALHGLFTYVRGRWAAEASEGIVRRLRHELYSHLERLPARYHDQADTGDLVQRCSTDVETVRVFLAAQVVEIARVALFLTIAAPIMLSQNLRMTVVVAGGDAGDSVVCRAVLSQGAASVRAGRRIRRAADDVAAGES